MNYYIIAESFETSGHGATPRFCENVKRARLGRNTTAQAARETRISARHTGLVGPVFHLLLLCLLLQANPESSEVYLELEKLRAMILKWRLVRTIMEWATAESCRASCRKPPCTGKRELKKSF
jgi:hypothetical protein